MLPKSFINPSDISMQLEAYFEIYLLFLNGITGLKNFLIYSDFSYLFQSDNPCRPSPNGPVMKIRSPISAVDLKIFFS